MPRKRNSSRDQPPPERLQKVLAHAGLGSRREVERWIAEGRLTVNGIAATPGQHWRAGVRLTLDGKRLRLPKQRAGLRVLMYHKPEGEICTRSDPQGRPTAFDRLPPITGGRWIGIGRLDVSSSGLMLFSNDGGLARHLMHPSANIDREYLIRVRGTLNAALLQRLRQGVELEDGPARFTDIQPGGEGTGSNRWFHVALMRGRNREVRRLWESQGIQVSRLKRTRFGPVSLTASLRRGRWRELSPAELSILTQDTGYSG